MSQPLINGVRHAWADIKVNMLGRTITGITSVDYDDTQDKKDNYGAGIYAVSRGNGKYEAKAKISLHKYEVEAIQDAIGGKRIQEIDPFDIVIAYMPVGQDTVKTDVIRNVQFTTNGRAVKTGDTEIVTDMMLITSHILWHGMTE